MNKISIIGLVGESVFLSVERLQKEGETVHADNFFTELGGKGFNQAIAARRSGASVSFMCAAGNDEFYGKIKRFLKKEKINATVRKKEGRTAYGVIERDRTGLNRVTVFKGAVLDESDVDFFEKQIKQSDILLLTNEIPEAVNIRAVKIAEKYGVKVIFNPAPVKEIAPEILKSVSLFTPNEHEKEALPDDVNTIVTLGEKGAYIKSLDLTVSAPKVNAVDTTGAGDVFNGTLCAMLATGKPVKDAVEYAVKASAYSVTKSGVVDAVPYKSDIE